MAGACWLLCVGNTYVLDPSHGSPFACPQRLHAASRRRSRRLDAASRRPPGPAVDDRGARRTTARPRRLAGEPHRGRNERRQRLRTDSERRSNPTSMPPTRNTPSSTSARATVRRSTSAENGSAGASVLIVHAASLENQFVAGGYSYDNQYGYAVFRNDFVLAGPAPTRGVQPGAPNAADNSPRRSPTSRRRASDGRRAPREFVSRGGTPGTTVRSIRSGRLSTARVCAGRPAAVRRQRGQRRRRDADRAGNGVDRIRAAVPERRRPADRRRAAGLVCRHRPDPGSERDRRERLCRLRERRQDSCYVFTDRGTFDYLASGQDPAGAIPNLTILTRGPQSARRPGRSRRADQLLPRLHHQSRQSPTSRSTSRPPRTSSTCSPRRRCSRS